MTTAAVKIGLIGTGTMGSIHARYFSELPDVEIAAIAEPNVVRRTRVAEQFRVKALYTDAMELIADDGLEAVVIATPHLTHGAIAIAALNAGKHVLVEKPMTPSPSEAQAILAAQKASGKTLLVGHHLRWMWPVAQLRQQIEEGRFGDIYYVKAGEFRRKGIPGWGSTYTQMQYAGGGAALDIGIHALDLAMYFMGHPKPLTVSGTTSGILGPRGVGIGGWGEQDPQGSFDVEDLAAAFVRLKGGRTLNLEVTWAAFTDAEENKSYVQVMGSLGGFTIRGGKPKWMFEASGQEANLQPSPPASVVDPRAAIARHFIDCVQGRAVPQVTGESAYLNATILDALYRSAAEGREVSDFG